MTVACAGEMDFIKGSDQSWWGAEKLYLFVISSKYQRSEYNAHECFKTEALFMERIRKFILGPEQFSMKIALPVFLREEISLLIFSDLFL